MIDAPPDASFDDPSLLAAEQAEPVRKPEVKVDDSVASLIKKFEQENEVPDVDAAVLNGMSKQREYVHTDANLATTPGGVSTNYLFKFQKVHKAQISAREPGIAVRPKKRMGQVDPMIMQMLTDFGDTMQALIKHFFGTDEMDLKAVVDGAIQDVDTVGIVFLKLDWLEDLQRDPVGAWRPTDFQATVARMKRLLAMKAEGKCVEGDAEWAEMKDIAATIKKQMEGEFWRKMAYSGVMPEGQDPRKVRWDSDMPGEPQLVELPKYRGFVLRSIMPEDCRRDWSIFRPEEFKRSKHFTYCTLMTEAQIREFYNIPDGDLLPNATAGITNPISGYKAPLHGDDPANRDPIQAKTRGDRYTVWVRMDRVANKHYHWIEGSDRFLREPETPEITTTNWFNVFPVYFNRVTGRFLPVSNTTLGKPLQEEINIVRTHKRQAKRAAYNRYVVTKDLFSKTEMDDLNNCRPNGYTSTTKSVEDLNKGIYRMPGEYNPAVHDVLEERQELGSMLNQSQASQGMTKGGSDSATEASIANQTSDSIAQDDKAALEALYRAVAVSMGEILMQAMPEENAKAIVGPGASWPMVDREQMWAHLLVEVEAGSTGLPDQQKRMEGLKAALDAGTAAGIGSIPGGPVWDGLGVVKKICEIMDWRDDPRSLIIMPSAPVPAQQPMGIPSTPGAPTDSPPQVPTGGGPAAAPAPEVPPAPTLPMTEQAPVPAGAA